MRDRCFQPVITVSYESRNRISEDMNPNQNLTTDQGLIAKHVCKTFGDVKALDDVTLDVAPGEFFTLLGPSGCGKTTLLRIIAGLELADSGRIFSGGKDITGLPAIKRQVNTVFQSYALFPHLTIYENIAFGLRSRKFPEAEIKKRVERRLEMLDLSAMAQRHPHQLSGGQKQRVALARALVNEPDVLLLDEPMSALDARLRAQVQEDLRRLQRKLGRTFILVTHDQAEALVCSDRLAVMRRGPNRSMRDTRRGVRQPPGQLRGQIPGSGQPDSLHQGAGRRSVGLRISGPGKRARLAGGDRGHPAGVDRYRRQEPERNGIRARVTEIVYRGTNFDCGWNRGRCVCAPVPTGELIPAGRSGWNWLPRNW